MPEWSQIKWGPRHPGMIGAAPGVPLLTFGCSWFRPQGLTFADAPNATGKEGKFYMVTSDQLFPLIYSASELQAVPRSNILSILRVKVDEMVCCLFVLCVCDILAPFVICVLYVVFDAGPVRLPVAGCTGSTCKHVEGQCQGQYVCI